MDMIFEMKMVLQRQEDVDDMLVVLANIQGIGRMRQHTQNIINSNNNSNSANHALKIFLHWVLKNHGKVRAPVIEMIEVIDNLVNTKKIMIEMLRETMNLDLILVILVIRQNNDKITRITKVDHLHLTTDVMTTIVEVQIIEMIIIIDLGTIP